MTQVGTKDKRRYLVYLVLVGESQKEEEGGWDRWRAKTRFIGTHEIGSDCNTDSV